MQTQDTYRINQGGFWGFYTVERLVNGSWQCVSPRCQDKEAAEREMAQLMEETKGVPGGTWTQTKWYGSQRDVVVRGRRGILQLYEDALVGKWYWSLGIVGGEIMEGKCGTFDAADEHEAVAKALRLAKKWGATW